MVPNHSSYQEFNENCSEIVQEKTGLKIDQPDSSGETTSTEIVARMAFSDESNFIECCINYTCPTQTSIGKSTCSACSNFEDFQFQPISQNR